MGIRVSYELNDGVACVVMDDGKVNALSPDMLRDLGAALDQAVTDDAAVVLAGRGSVFCAGYDLAVINAVGNARRDLVEQGFDFSLRLLQHPRPTVIACNGAAVAMGAIILLCADYRLGAEGAYKIGTNEVALGMGMPWAGVEVARQRLSSTHFLRAVALAETFSPHQSVSAGFLDEVTDREELLHSAIEKARSLAVLNRGFFQQVKQRVRASAIEAIRAGYEKDKASGDR